MADQLASQQRNHPSPPEGVTGWPDGWYVYENGRLNGPLTAADTFTLPADAQDGTPRLVSRKGFTQWYALKDLSEIFKVTDQMEKKVAAASTTVAKKPGVQAKQVGPQNRTRTPLDLDRERLRQASAAQIPTPALRQAVGVPTIQPAPSLPKTAAKKAIVQEYFIARTRLRLGQLRNPWAAGVSALPFSLGIYWAMWFTSIHREIAFHTQDAIPVPKWLRTKAAISVIPFVTMIMAYSLAKRIREMEVQNKYKHVSPGLACFLALVPPISLGYLQSALNRHWLLHAKHVVMKRRNEAAAPVQASA